MKTNYEEEVLTNKNTGVKKTRGEWWDEYSEQNKIDTWQDFCKQLEGFKL